MFNFLFDLILIDIVGHTVARFVLPLLSFGRISVAPHLGPIGPFNALGYRSDRNGRIELDQRVAGFLGLLFCVAASLALGLVTSASF